MTNLKSQTVSLSARPRPPGPVGARRDNLTRPPAVDDASEPAVAVFEVELELRLGVGRWSLPGTVTSQSESK
jgi:hypothetical protein